MHIQNHNRTAVTVNRVTLAEATPPVVNPNHSPLGPTARTINFTLPHPANAHALAANAATDFTFVMGTKVPGGADVAPGEPPLNLADCRLFKLAEKPKVVSATATPNADGSHTITLTLTLTSEVVPDQPSFSELQKHAERLIPVKNATTALSETDGVHVSASPDSANGNTKLVVSFRHR